MGMSRGRLDAKGVVRRGGAAEQGAPRRPTGSALLGQAVIRDGREADVLDSPTGDRRLFEQFDLEAAQALGIRHRLDGGDPAVPQSQAQPHSAK